MLKRFRRYLYRLYLRFNNRCEFCGCYLTVRHLDCAWCLDGRYCHACSKTFYFASVR